MLTASARERWAPKDDWRARLISPSVIAASTKKGEEHQDDDEHPQQRTHGDASNQRQDDQNDQQKHDEIHAYDPTPTRAKAIRDIYWRTVGKSADARVTSVPNGPAWLDSSKRTTACAIAEILTVQSLSPPKHLTL
jgi:hypothetical protein